ncbi:sensor histidine kinase [Streptomyces sp. RKAG293]|uniref:sensor histidine kinase n=1 Tax=Streptomyces sp. RKAG293 TaxID=2893403 RepID=UPI0020332502|nr:sensor histidine kinase [Streptomyces sp. RKAG293]MCM2420821.1 sensor histidine kinase [Streptomyces sp. RKAG293]
MHSAFVLLLGASLTRFVVHHPGAARVPWVIGLSVALAVLYALGPAAGRAGPSAHRLWLAAVVVAWVVIVLLAPSFAWCAIPLFYTGLRTLPARAAIILVAALTVLVVISQLRLADGFDPNLLLLPPAVAGLATAVFLHMQRQATRQHALIDDLVRTQRELAATERRAGALAERQRLAMEIHDSLAQGLSSQQMLLQAAARTWDTDPATARTHLTTATSIVARNLAEARAFVHDLAPADLADGGTLHDALRALAERESAESGLPVRFHLDGSPDGTASAGSGGTGSGGLPAAAQAALMRIAQGALANVREHAGASAAVITLSYLGDQAVLDIADDGRGFDPADRAGPTSGTAAEGAGRGHGLPAMRARLRQFGGTLTVESGAGEGTVVTATIPLEHQ